MSEKSFALASVSVAIVWGTFFYPPAPRPATSDDARPAILESGREQLMQPQHVLAPAAAKPAARHADQKTDCAPGVVNHAASCSIAQN